MNPLIKAALASTFFLALMAATGGAVSAQGDISIRSLAVPIPKDQIITLEDRNLNCFMRSMNGVRPPNGSEVSVAIATYITWLSEGYPIKMSLKDPFGPNSRTSLKIDPVTADMRHGKTLYASTCADCHGQDAAGVGESPPLWGAKSYNSGEGLAQNLKLATYLKYTMPLGNPSLSDKDALDLAAYVNAQPRPKFVLEEHLGKSQ
ncbi:MAG TPA: c-type cytochrome [Rhodocyclaceae bacterium]|nr:c-type cytochrome [Rhodocyclaceae bacterium]